MKTCVHLWLYLAEFFLEWEICQTKFMEEIKPNILCSIFFFSENRAVYEIMWKNIVQPARPMVTIYNMAHALCMLDSQVYRHTLRIWIIIYFPQQRIRESTSLLRYTHAAFRILCVCVYVWIHRKTVIPFYLPPLNFRTETSRVAVAKFIRYSCP